jgi:hypothetical protein
MRLFRLALVVVLALIVRGALHKPEHFGLAASFSTHLADSKSVERVSAQLQAWEQQLRARGFKSIANQGATNVHSSANGADKRSESRDVTLVGKMEDLGRVQVRIRTDDDLDADKQATIEVQVERKENTEAWARLEKTAQHMLQPKSSR